ncbi:2'-5' RNA ligase family protein [Paenarthrobacter sp. Z7-10]|nr:2'-5' RNA ligase family protein [Paenarthrobacter sp. Z7-10]
MGEVADTPSDFAGVVIALPEPLASDLLRWRLSFGDTGAEVIPAHITLVTTTPVGDWQATASHVRRIAARQRPFTVMIEGTSSFRPISPVVYLKVRQGFENCVSLHADLQLGPLQRILPFPYHPHITVAHGVSDENLDEAQETLRNFRASFPVRSMGLYEHSSSGVWKLQEEFSFGGKRESATAGNGPGQTNRKGQARP